MKKTGRTFLKGAYFPYCQWCRKDGHCILRHYQFLGVEFADHANEFRFAHEDLSCNMSAFQRNTTRAVCGGRIFETESFYLPLYCECGTVISSLTLSTAMGTGFCAKFQPSEKGKERMRMAEKIAKEKGIDISEVDPDDLPPADEKYVAAMMY